MSSKEAIYGKYKDETGEEYYCPLDAVADGRLVSGMEIDDCVEASTTERYSGHLTILDRKVG